MHTLLVVTLALSAAADDPKIDAATTALRQGSDLLHKQKYADAITALSRCITLEPERVEAYQLRGFARCFAGQFKESVADFDKAIELNPKLADGHWQRGLALYYAGEYEKARDQFKRDEKVFGDDVENAAWHFLCIARKDGVESARKQILKISKDARPPMMTVYALFKGDAKPEDVIAEADAAEKNEKLRPEHRKLAHFYGHLYLGLYYEALGDAKKAKEHIDQAANKYHTTGYMGQIAQVHDRVLKAK
jgi:lipoprotein NlpI